MNRTSSHRIVENHLTDKVNIKMVRHMEVSIIQSSQKSYIEVDCWEEQNRKFINKSYYTFPNKSYKDRREGPWRVGIPTIETNLTWVDV